MAIKKRNNTGPTGKKKLTTKKINFKMVAPEAENVFLVGDFNDWNISAHPLKSNSKGIWKISLELMPGRYEYRFLIDGGWRNDPNNTTFAPNPFGSDNSVINLD